MTNEKLTDVVRRLLADRRFLARFRRDPAAATARYGLTAPELDALKSGDQARLIALGLDPGVVDGRPTAQVSWTQLLPVVRRLTAPAALAALLAAAMLPGATASAADKECPVGKRCFGQGRAARRIGSIRTSGPSGLRRASGRAATERVMTVKGMVRESMPYDAGLMRAMARLGPPATGDTPGVEVR